MAPHYVVVGAGEAGRYHARQLKRALAAGAVSGEVVVLDDDWAARLGSWLAGASPDDHLVPAPVGPHLLWDWLAREAGATPAEPPTGWGLPFEAAGGAGVRFLSAAAWTCPATCVEPDHCPAIHAPRDWDLADLIEGRAVELGWEAVVFRCLHLTHGVGTVPAASILAARERARRLPAGTRLLVATSSRCHAAVGGLRAGRSG